MIAEKHPDSEEPLLSWGVSAGLRQHVDLKNFTGFTILPSTNRHEHIAPVSDSPILLPPCFTIYLNISLIAFRTFSALFLSSGTICLQKHTFIRLLPWFYSALTRVLLLISFQCHVWFLYAKLHLSSCKTWWFYDLSVLFCCSCEALWKNLVFEKHSALLEELCFD